MKILLVEDHQHLAKSIKKGLEINKYVVDITFDGLEAYDLASNEKYDLIILDRMLPGMSGIKICQKLRQEKKKVPILMLTAKAEVEDRVEGLECGADDYLIKPFVFKELLARIKALTRRSSANLKEINNQLKVADLVLDLNSFQVSRADKVVKLSQKEFALLDFLVRHKGHTFTAEQLVEKVWPFESDILANTVQVYIGYLRKKIDKAFPKSPPLIYTVRGFGYKLDYVQ